MKPGSNGRRPRGRPNRKQHGGQSRPNNFDSSGPEGRVRGNAHQVYERYLAMARDAVSASDRIAAETYYQYAEHYFRVLNSSTDPQQNGQARQDRRGGDGRRDDKRQDGARHEGARQEGDQQVGQRTSEAQNGSQPVTPAAPAGNGQEAPPQPARSENRSGRQPRRTAPAAPVTEKTKGNGAAAEADNAAAQPNPQADGGDCEPVSA